MQPTRIELRWSSSEGLILLIEDHADTASLMERYLEVRGHAIITAHSVTAALEVAAAEEGRFDLVLSDLGLPDGSGLDLMRQLRESYGLVGVCLSGYGTQEDIRSSKAAGFSEHLIKPVNLQKLESILARLSAS